MISDRPNYDEASEIAELVADWQPRHFVLLRSLADPVAADREMGNVVGSGGGITTSLNAMLTKLLPNWDEEQIERTWMELRDARVSGGASLKAMMTDRGIHHLSGRLTPFGQKVLAYVTNPAHRSD